MEYRIATEKDIDLMMSSRLEMLREVNSLDDEYQYSEQFVSDSRAYFLDGDQTTVLALEGGKAVGCASICYIRIMPTFCHPTGNRAHITNVYTSKEYRRQGVAMKMVSMLIEDAWKRGATEISLDATKAGRPLYEKLGFIPSGECMALVRKTGQAE